MKFVYFSWIRERLDLSDEEVMLPDAIKTISDLTTWMKSRDEVFQSVFEHEGIVRIAVDQAHVDDPSFDITNVKEIAFFPPMTGG